MAFIGLRVPSEAARVLETIDVPGDRSAASDMHVTIVYLGKGVPSVQVAKAMVILESVVSAFRPFTVDVTGVSNFPRNPDDGWPLICLLDSPELQAIHAGLKAGLARYGVPFSDKYPEYRPHVTLSYVRDDSPGFSFQKPLLSPVPISVHELTIWGGDRGPGQLTVTVPLPLSARERMAARVAASSSRR